MGKESTLTVQCVAFNTDGRYMLSIHTIQFHLYQFPTNTQGISSSIMQQQMIIFPSFKNCCSGSKTSTLSFLISLDDKQTLVHFRATRNHKKACGDEIERCHYKQPIHHCTAIREHEQCSVTSNCTTLSSTLQQSPLQCTLSHGSTLSWVIRLFKGTGIQK